jgi:hypothetical protein
MVIKVITTPPNYDSDDVLFLDEEGAILGFGFKPKGRPAESIRILTCPACRAENYAAHVNTGTCCWCGFRAPELEPPKEKEEE